MQKNIFSAMLVFFMGTSLLYGQVTLKGRITNEKGESLIGATVYFPDLKSGASTNLDGFYTINNLPKGKFLAQVKLIGYKTITEQVELAEVTFRDFVLNTSVVEVKEVIVTGVSQATERNRTPTPVTTIGAHALLQTQSQNIIDAIANQPGISQVTTGAGISKPVIRGLGSNRVLVVNDGIRQEGQQWGDEHGIEVDEYSITQVEILKGPASLAYGSDAMAGVIHLISVPSLEDGVHRGSILTNYQTNNGLLGGSANMSGNSRGFVYSLRASMKQAHSYQNKADGYVFNSGFREHGYSGIIGLNRKWGFSHLHVSDYFIAPGIVEGERDSSSGQFIRPLAISADSVDEVVVNNSDNLSYDSFVPYQEVKHQKAVSVNSFVIRNSRLSATLGYQRNQRKEFGDVVSSAPGLYFDLYTVNYDLRFILPEKNGFQSSVGVNGMKQRSLNKGIEFLVPEYELFDAGMFALLRKSYNKLDISGGLRYDTRQLTIQDLYVDTLGMRTSVDNSAIHIFRHSDNSYSGFSGSVGASYLFSGISFAKVNISKGYRAPNISETGSNGIHEGSLRYEIGDPSLKAESSLQTDLAFGINSDHVTAEIDVFNNHISNFIFPEKLSSFQGTDSITDGSPTFRYTSGNAVLNGGEILVDVHPHPLDWLHIQNSFSYVNAYRKEMPDSMRYLPGIPPARYQAELMIHRHGIWKNIKDPYVQLGAQVYFSQDNIYSAYGTETRTPSYTLFSCGGGFDVGNEKRDFFSLYISVTNLTDVIYQSHLSRLKYAPVNYMNGRQGVFNMGRNVSFKLIVPFGFKKKASS